MPSLGSEIRVSRPRQRVPRKGESTVVQNLVGTFDVLAKADPLASVTAHIEHLRDLGYVVTSPRDDDPEKRRQPSKVVAIRVIWKEHDLNSHGWNENLDHEIAEFDWFMWRFLNIGVNRLELPKIKPAPYLQREMRRLLREIHEDTLLIFLYSGHGRTSENQELELHSGHGESVQWAPIAGQMENTIRGQALVIMDACESGSAAAAFSTFQDSIHPQSPIRDLQQNIVVLAASPWSTSTTAWGPGTLKKRIASAICSLLHNGRPLSVVAIYAHISRAAIWNTMDHPLWLTSSETDDMIIPVDLGVQFRSYHRQLVEHESSRTLLAELEADSSKEIVWFLRFPFAVERFTKSCGTAYWIPSDDNPMAAVQTIVQGWRTNNTRLRENVNVSLRYFGHVLDLEAPLMEQLREIKEANVSDGAMKSDRVYVVGIVIEDPHDTFGGLLKGCLKIKRCRRIEDDGYIYNSCGADGVNTKMLRRNDEEYEDEQPAPVIEREPVIKRESNLLDTTMQTVPAVGISSRPLAFSIKPEPTSSFASIVRPALERERPVKQEPSW